MAPGTPDDTPFTGTSTLSGGAALGEPHTTARMF